MCWFHIKHNFVNHKKLIPVQYQHIVTQDIHNIHNALNHQMYLNLVHETLTKWSQNPALQLFSDYFKKEWIRSRFWRWSTYHSPPGYTPTNCTIESYNRDIKRVHVHERLSDMNLLVTLRKANTKKSFEITRTQIVYWIEKTSDAGKAPQHTVKKNKINCRDAAQSAFELKK